MANAKINFIGTVINNPSMHQYSKDNQNHDFIRFTVMVNTSVKRMDKNGFEQNYYDVSFDGAGLSYLKTNLKKGSIVNINGELALLTYTNDNDNTNRTVLRTIATAVDILNRENNKINKEHKKEEDINEIIETIE